MKTENKISKSKNALLVLPSVHDGSDELNDLKENFCGRIVKNLSDIQDSNYLKVYVCGDLEKIENLSFEINIIKEFSCNYEQLDNINLLDLGKVPLVIHHVGVYFKNLFDDGDYFNVIQ